MALLVTTACTREDSTHRNEVYTCPMHPTVQSDRPGACPVCGMNLVRKARPGEEIKITSELLSLTRPANESVVASVKTIKGLYKSAPVSIHARGIVTYDSRNIFTIPSRVAGRVEKVYLRFPFQRVSKGEKIAEIYSPELITAQRELLYLVENDSQNIPLVGAARRKLELLGMSGAQINSLTAAGEANHTFSVYSPFTGYVVTTAEPSVTSDSGQNMEAPTMKPAASGNLLRQGAYVSAGQTLFTIVNDSALRIELSLPAAGGESIKEGTEVELHLRGQQNVLTEVDFVQPFFTDGQDFLKVRVYVRDTGKLRIGQLVDATVKLPTAEGLWVPRTAVVDLGLRKVIFALHDGVFKAKAITTGASANGMIEITSGLASTEEIASNAQFLVDSESFIKPE